MTLNKGNFKRIRQLDKWQDVNKLIEFNLKWRNMKVMRVGRNQKYTSTTEARYSPEFDCFGKTMIIYEGLTKLEITSKYSPESCKVTTWVFNLNGEDTSSIAGQQAYAQLCRAYKIPDFRENSLMENWYFKEQGRFQCSASPIVGYNRKFNKTRLYNVYEYDLNSAYSSVMLNGLPDTSEYREKDYVKNGEVGFILDEKLTMVDIEGGYSDVIFKIMPCPDKLKDWLIDCYNEKKTAIGIDRQRAKAFLNYPIGYCQRTNPFIRSYIVHKCNARIDDLIDKDTIFWNTDAIFSIRKRDDLEIGDDIGQFKEVLIDSVYYDGNNYQIGLNEPCYRGIPKQWFKSFAKMNGRPFDMEKDGLPPKMNKFIFNWDTLRLEKNKEIDYGISKK